MQTSWWEEGKQTPPTKGKEKEQQRCDALQSAERSSGGIQRDGRICEQQLQKRFSEQRSGQTKRDQRGDRREDLGSKQKAAVGDAGASISRKRFHLSAVISVSLPLQ